MIRDNFKGKKKWQDMSCLLKQRKAAEDRLAFPGKFQEGQTAPARGRKG